MFFSYIATKLLWKFERYDNKRAENMRTLTSETRDHESFAPVGCCYRPPPLILIITIFGRSLSDYVYLVPREIDHIPAHSVCPRLLSV